jgi:hypothetical protein
MEENKIIQIIFGSKEMQVYNLIQKICAEKGISMEEYVKDVIKKDLAWGHFAKPRKTKKDK